MASYFYNNYVRNYAAARHTRHLGRDYLVVPVTMIVPGVLHGSKGALFYPDKVLRQNVSAWNGLPVLLGHPTTGSGRSPDTVERQCVGTIYNARISDRKLAAEAWLDVERLRALAPDALRKIENGGAVEVSTGLDADLDNTPGSHDGKVFNATLLAIRPDHLAMFADGNVGACSVRQGCGINNTDRPTPLGLPTWDGGPCVAKPELSAAVPRATARRRHGAPEPLGLPSWDDYQPVAANDQVSAGAGRGAGRTVVSHSDKPQPLGLPRWEGGYSR